MNEKLERKQLFQLLFGKKSIFLIGIILLKSSFIRQLEAMVRISESLAKMRLAPFANESDVDEALRLFHVSTLSSAGSGNLAGIEGFTTREDQEEISRIEKQIRRRFVVGSQVSEHAIVQDFIRQVRIKRNLLINRFLICLELFRTWYL
jgi:DNA replicative helicase MCM subunit Mcm2 (Cdc46/Mcm family)